MRLASGWYGDASSVIQCLPYRRIRWISVNIDGHDCKSGPSQVMIARHGEKLGDSSSDKDGGPNLSMRGSARAAALPQLSAPAQTPYGCALSIGKSQSFTGGYVAVQIPGTAPRFSTPAFLFVTQASKSSNRSVETITPLSVALNLTTTTNTPTATMPRRPATF
jgi:hypothetical protein